MKIILVLLTLLLAAPAFAGPLDIRQVDTDTLSPAQAQKEADVAPEENSAAVADHQSTILNNAAISDYGRASALTHFNESQKQGGASIDSIKQDAQKTLDESDLSGGNAATAHRKGKRSRKVKGRNGELELLKGRQDNQ